MGICFTMNFEKGTSTVEMDAARYERMETVIAAARSGNRDLVKLALADLDAKARFADGDGVSVVYAEPGVSTPEAALVKKAVAEVKRQFPGWLAEINVTGAP